VLYSYIVYIFIWRDEQRSIQVVFVVQNGACVVMLLALVLMMLVMMHGDDGGDDGGDDA
jgi:preprotein translocase subunit YajC